MLENKKLRSASLDTFEFRNALHTSLKLGQQQLNMENELLSVNSHSSLT